MYEWKCECTYLHKYIINIKINKYSWFKNIEIEINQKYFLSKDILQMPFSL